MYKRQILAEIEKKLPGFPIVLHGASSVPQEYVKIINTHGGKLKDAVGIPEEQLRTAAKSAVCKINIDSDGRLAMTAAVRKVWDRHLMVKLSPNVTDITEIAAAVEGAGADSVSLVNTFLAMHIDVERQRPSISTITGGLSGPAIRPIAVRMVWQVARRVHIPVVGLGGITNSDDALQFIMAGATTGQIGTYNFVDPAVTIKTIDGIRAYLTRHNIPDINNLIGIINK